MKWAAAALDVLRLNLVRKDRQHMFALTYAQYGDPSVLEVTNTPEPHAGPGQGRRATRASGGAPGDGKIRAGHLQGVFDIPLPAIVGLEAAGVVDEVGE